MRHHFILDNNIITGVSLGLFDIFVPPLDESFAQQLLFFSTTNKLVGNRTLDFSTEGPEEQQDNTLSVSIWLVKAYCIIFLLILPKLEHFNYLIIVYSKIKSWWTTDGVSIQKKQNQIDTFWT